MARLTNIEKYALQGMLADGKSTSVMSKTIGKPVSIIENEDSEAVQPNIVEATPPQIKKQLSATQQLFARNQQGTGMAISTEAAAMRGDEHNKAVSKSANPFVGKGMIYKIDDQTIQ